MRPSLVCFSSLSAYLFGSCSAGMPAYLPFLETVPDVLMAYLQSSSPRDMSLSRTPTLGRAAQCRGTHNESRLELDLEFGHVRLIRCWQARARA